MKKKKKISVPLIIIFSFFFSVIPLQIHADNTIPPPDKSDDSKNPELEELSKQSLEDLMAIRVVTASKSGTLLSEVPAMLRVVTENDIRRHRYRYLQEALYDLPGFDISFMQGLYGPIMRQGGLDEPENLRTLIFINGIPDNNISAGSAYIKHKYCLRDVKRIEVLYGPASSLYGANAFTGVINLITKDGGDIKNYAEYGLGGIAYDTRFKRLAPYANLTIGHKFGNKKDDFSFIISGHWINTKGPILNQHDFPLPQYSNYWWTDTYSGSALNNNYMVSIALSWKNLTLGFFRSRDFTGEGAFATGAAYSDNSKLTFWNTTTNTAYAKYNFTIGKVTNKTQIVYRETPAEGTDGDVTFGDPTGLLNNSFELTWYRRDDKEVSADNSAIIKWTDTIKTTLGVSGFFQYAWNYSKYSFTYPNIYVPLEFGITPSPSNFPYNKYKYGNYALYFEQEIKFLKKISLTLGYRYDRFIVKGRKWKYLGATIPNTDGIMTDAQAAAAGFIVLKGYQIYATRNGTSIYDAHNPRVGLVYTPLKNLSIKCLYGEAFRAPTVREMHSTSSSRITNADLKPEKIRTIELGAIYIPHKIVRIEFDSYLSFVQDMITLASTVYHKGTGTDLLAQFQNTGKARSAGFNISVHTQPTKWFNAYASYSFVDSRLYSVRDFNLKSHDPSNYFKTSNFMPRIARHKGNIGVNFLIIEHINIDVRANIIGPKQNIYTNPYRFTPGYILFNGSLGSKDWPVKGMDITFKVYNILNQKLRDPGLRNATGTYYPAATPLPRRYLECELTHKI